ncbi:MAG: hypothetical protein ACTHQM_03185 [Thermoanaerobaculia bacterium]
MGELDVVSQITGQTPLASPEILHIMRTVRVPRSAQTAQTTGSIAAPHFFEIFDTGR